MRVTLLLVGVMLTSEVCAQFEIGGSAGAYTYALRTDNRSSFSPVDRPGFLASFWYRERAPDGFGIGIDLQWSHRVFDAYLCSCGLGGGSAYNTRVVLEQFHIGLLPEVRLGPEGRAFLRFGPRFGLGALGSVEGTYSSWGLYSPSTGPVPVNSSASRFYKGDFRFHLGFSVVVARSGRMRYTIDPYVEYGFGSMLKDASDALRTSDLGVKFSIGQQSAGSTFGTIMRRGRPGPKE